MGLLKRPNKINDSVKKEKPSRASVLTDKIRELEEEISDLEEKLSQNTKNLDGAADAARTRPGENPRGGARRMKLVTKDLLRENNSIKSKLATAKAKRKRLLEQKRVQDIKSQYAGESVTNGGNIMGNIYTDDDVKEAKLKIYESCRAGRITEEEKQDLLYALEASVEEYNENVDAWLEQQEMLESTEGLDFNAMKVFVYESAEQGLLTEDEKDFFLQYL